MCPRSVLSLPLLLAASACTGSPATLAARPDFTVATSAGPAAVCVREAPLGIPLEEFAQVVRNGMQREMPASAQADAVVPSDPERRFVWHVYPVAPRGASRIVVNAFDGSAPFAYEQQVVEDGAPAVAMTSTVGSMTRQLMAKLEQRREVARG